VAAFLSRAYPDANTPEAAAELTNILQGVDNNWPGLIEELRPSFRQEKLIRNQEGTPDGAGALNCTGPILNRAISRFGAKIAYALHFEETGKPVPNGGAAAVWWLTNFQSLQGDLPNDLLALMTGSKTLRQGRKEVSEQFGYDSIRSDTGSMSAHFATFRFSFAICAFVGVREDLVTVENMPPHVCLFRPGWLK